MHVDIAVPAGHKIINIIMYMSLYTGTYTFLAGAVVARHQYCSPVSIKVYIIADRYGRKLGGGCCDYTYSGDVGRRPLAIHVSTDDCIHAIMRHCQRTYTEGHAAISQ